MNDGLVVAGPSLSYRVREAAAARAGLDVTQIGEGLETAMLGSEASYVLEGDRTRTVRVLLSRQQTDTRAQIDEMPVRSLQGARLTLDDVAQAELRSGQLERHREDLRELIAVSGRLSGRDLGSGIAAIKQRLSQTLQKFPPASRSSTAGCFSSSRSRSATC